MSKKNTMSQNEEYVPHWSPPGEVAARVYALESLLVEKGHASHDAIDSMISSFENDLGPMWGAKVVARSWTDPDFKKLLLEDTNTALTEMDCLGLQTEHVIAVENTPKVHNVFVCTLCSCYPWKLLGIPPWWFKTAQFRSRIVIEPRSVLKEFDLELDENVEIRVWDTSAEIRYLVVDERPAGTDGWSAEDLAKLVTRDSMIGVKKALTPGEVGK